MVQQSSVQDLALLGIERKSPRPVPELITDQDNGSPLITDEAGTAPEDRRFRPDIEGMRALAILLVVFYHAGVPGLSGGFVGVDVFFVISGFVITGLMLREHAVTKRTRLQAFYGRRARRILPAASLVIIVTVLGSYKWLGFLTGNATATVAKSASLFYANFHFIATGTNYLASQQPPSALQNYWSLSVEEQFYIVYPSLFLFAALIWPTRSMRAKMTILLVVGLGTSLIWSIQQTSANTVAAYFSPFTRAWELALGGLVAVASSKLIKFPRLVAATATWIGLTGVLVAAFLFNSSTKYPGVAVMLPVIGTALVIAGGTAQPRIGTETILRTPPFQWLGRLSYSLYLWHWPILIIATQHVGHALPVQENLLLVLLALGLSVGSYYLIENPIRHWKYLWRSADRSITLGVILIAVTLLFVTIEIANHSGTIATADGSNETSPASIVESGATRDILRSIAASSTIRSNS